MQNIIIPLEELNTAGSWTTVQNTAELCSMQCAGVTEKSAWFIGEEHCAVEMKRVLWSQAIWSEVQDA